MPALDLELLEDHVLNYLDLDPRFWDQDEGAFDFCGERVFYRRLPDAFMLEVAGLELELPRP
jgi:hypothetical protein